MRTVGLNISHVPYPSDGAQATPSETRQICRIDAQGPKNLQVINPARLLIRRKDKGIQV